MESFHCDKMLYFGEGKGKRSFKYMNGNINIYIYDNIYENRYLYIFNAS